MKLCSFPFVRVASAALIFALLAPAKLSSCPIADYETLLARAIEEEAAPSLSVHLDRDGGQYTVDYKGFNSPEEFLEKNPNCCEDFTKRAQQEYIPPELVKKLDITTSITITSKWEPITPGLSENYTRISLHHFNRCGELVHL